MNKHNLIREVAKLTGEKIGTVELVLASRVARNPRTGVEAEVPARTAVKFTAHKSLKDAANSANRSVK